MAEYNNKYTLTLALQATGVSDIEDKTKKVIKVVEDLEATVKSYDDRVNLVTNQVTRNFDLQGSSLKQLHEVAKQLIETSKEEYASLVQAAREAHAKANEAILASYLSKAPTKLGGFDLSGILGGELIKPFDEEAFRRNFEQVEAIYIKTLEKTKQEVSAVTEAENLKRKEYQLTLEIEKLTALEGSEALITLKKKEALDFLRIEEDTRRKLKAIKDEFTKNDLNEAEYAAKSKQILDEDFLRKQQAQKAVIQFSLDKERAEAEVAREKLIQEERIANAKIASSELLAVQRNYLAETERLVNLEKTIKISGANSANAILQEAANKVASIREASLLKLRQIITEENILLKGEAAVAKEAADERIRARKAELDIMQGVPNLVQKTGAHVQTLGEHFGRLFRHISEVYFAWGLLNTVSSKFSEAVKSIIPVGIALDSVKSSLVSTMGSSAGAESAIETLGKEAQRTGLAIGTLRTNFANFQASTSLAGASLEQTWKMFQNINTVSVALHKTSDETNHIFLAMSQIFNKSKVQSEELVKQLGNLLPGAFASFAASYKQSNGKIGISTGELTRLMKEGLVDAKTTMLDFTQFYADKFAGSFALASQMVNSNIGRMQTEFTLLGETIYGQSTGAIQEFTKGMANLTKEIRLGITEGTNFNKLLYLTKNAIISLATAGVAVLALKLESAILASRGLAGALEFLKSPTVIVAGISAIVSGLTDYIHSTQEASIATSEFFEELRKKKEEAAASPEIQLKIQINKSESVKAVNEQLALVEKDIKENLTGTLPVVFKSSAVIEALNKEIPLLKEYDSTLKEITTDEYYAGIAREKYLKIKSAEREFLLKQKNFEIETSKAQIERANTEAAIREQENRYGNEPRKKLLQSAILEQRIYLEEQKFLRAKEAKDFDEAAKHLDAKMEAEAKYRITLVNEHFSEEQAILDKREKQIKDRKAAGTFGDKTDLEEEKNLLEARKNYETAYSTERLKAENENLKAREALQREKENLLKRESSVEFKSIQKEGEIAATKEEVAIEKLTTAYKEGTLSIATYYQKLSEATADKFSKQGEALEQNIILARQNGLLDKTNEFQQQLQLLSTKETKELEVIEQNRLRDLVSYNKSLQEAHAEYLSITGKRDIGVTEKFLAENQVKINKARTEGNVAIAEEIEVTGKLKGINEELKEIERQRSDIEKETANRKREIELLLKSNAMSPLEANMEMNRLNEEEIKQLEEKLKLHEEILAKKKESEKTPEDLDRIKQEKLALQALKAEGDLVTRQFNTEVRQAFTTAFSSVVVGAQSASEAFRGFGQSVVKSISDIIAKELESQTFSLLKTGLKLAIESFTGTPETPAIAHAKGGTFTNSVVSEPTYFKFAKGTKTGLMGEAGPEAVVPLAKDSSGRLGITNIGPSLSTPQQIMDNSQTAVYNNHNISVNVTAVPGQNPDQMGQAISKSILKAMIQQGIYEASRPANQLNRLTKVS